MEEILMKIFVSVKYLLSLDRNRIAVGYPKYYGLQSDCTGISEILWIAIGSQWDIRVIVRSPSDIENTIDSNQIAIGYLCYSDVYQLDSNRIS